MDDQRFEKSVLVLILISSLVRIFLAFNLELGNDEVYYWTYSQNLQWNYFDHPPFIAWIIRLFTLNLRLQYQEGFLRMGSLVCSALSTYFIFRLTSEIKNSRAGFLAALIYTSSLYGSVICGILVMPDSPQMVFWILSLWCMVGILKNETSWKSWMGLALFSGLCILSKVHGVFLWFGLGTYLLLYKRKILGTVQPYLAIFICLFLISPILFWNLQNHFITYRFHSERVVIHGLDLSPLNFLREILGQISYNNPIIVGFSILGLFHFRKIASHTRLPEVLILFNIIALPLILLVMGISLFRVTLPHWAGPGYIALIPLTSIYFESIWDKKPAPLAIRIALGSLISFVILAYIMVQFYPGTLNPLSDQSQAYMDSLGMGDITLDLSGWKETGKRFQEIMRDEIKKEGFSSPPPLIVDNWYPGSHLYYYFAFPIGMPVIGLGREYNLHQFVWSNTVKIEQGIHFETAYAMVVSNNPINPVKAYSPYFKTVEKIACIQSFRGSKIWPRKISRNFYLYKLSGFKGYIPHLEEGEIRGLPPERP